MRGHVRKRGKKWAIVLYLGIGDDGKKKYKWYSGYNTRKDAEKDLPRRLQEAGDLGVSLTQDETVAAFMERYLAHKATTLRPNSLIGYRESIRTYIIPRMGKIPLSKLTPRHVQDLYTFMRAIPVSSRTIRRAHAVLHNALDYAIKWGILTRNVTDAVDPPRIERRKATVWTLEQALDFLEVSRGQDDLCWIGFYLAVMTGMRQGEIFGLRWSDIDFERGYIHVQQTVSWSSGHAVFQEPKTDSSRRAIAITEDDIKVLQSHRIAQSERRLRVGEAYQDLDLVLTLEDGRPMGQRRFSRSWHRALERAGYPSMRFHDLRHTHASLLLERDVHLKIVSERLGHSAISITADLYTHVLPGIQKRAADTLGDAVRSIKKR